MTDLLKILRNNGVDTPITASTLLKTPKTIKIAQRSGCEYMYFGLKDSISTCLSKADTDVLRKVDVVELKVNIDDLPVFKSSVVSLWPILCTIFNVFKFRPFVVALYCGRSKPKDLDFLTDFITELKQVEG